MKLVSVVVPAYNRASWLPVLLARLTELSAWIFEVIVVDDGSTDETLDVLRHYPHVRTFQQANQGPSAARNLGLEQAKGEFIHFLDSDDLPDAAFYPLMLNRLQGSDTLMAVANYRTASVTGQVLAENYFQSRGWVQLLHKEPYDLNSAEFQGLLLQHSIIPTSGVLLRRSSITLPWNPRVRVGEDRLFLLLNLAATAGRVAFNPQPLWTYQVHDANAFHANPRPDRLAYRDNLSLKHIAMGLPTLNAADLKRLAASRARNYFDWAWYCRVHGRRTSASTLLRAAWHLAPSFKILRARIVNWLRIS